MRYAQYAKFSHLYPHENVVKHFKLNNKSYYHKGLLFRPINPKKGIRIGYDGDDFMRNLFTVVIEQQVFRVPRIFKKLYK